MNPIVAVTSSLPLSPISLSFNAPLFNGEPLSAIAYAVWALAAAFAVAAPVGLMLHSLRETASGRKPTRKLASVRPVAIAHRPALATH